MDNFLSLSGADLDRRIASVYAYWKLRGFWSSFFHYFNRVFYLHFTLALLCFIIFFVDYDMLLKEVSGGESITLQQLVRDRRPWSVELVVYLLFCACLSFSAIFLYFLPRALDLRRTRLFYLDLGISDELLLTLSWEAIPRKLHRLSPRHTPLSLEQRLLRMDNFFVHLYTTQTVQNAYLNFFDRLVHPGTNTFFFSFFPRVLSLHTQPVHALLSRAVDDALFRDGQLRAELCGPSAQAQFALEAARGALQRRLRLYGVLSVLVAPIALPAALVWTLVKYAPQMQVEMSGGGVKSMDWNFVAKMEMRNFMELDHSIERRLHEGYHPVLTFLGNFQRPVLSKLAELVLFPIGALLGALTLLLLVNRDLTILGFSAVWVFVTIIVPSAYFLSSLIPSKHAIFNPHAPYAELTAALPYLSYSDPDTIPQFELSLSRDLRLPPTTRTVAFFSQYFESKFILILKEGLSLLFFPLVFLFILPSAAKEFVEFFHENAVTSPLDVGTIDRYCDVAVDGSGGVEVKTSFSEMTATMTASHGVEGMRRIVMERKVAASLDMYRERYFGKEKGFTSDESPGSGKELYESGTWLVEGNEDGEFGIQ